MAPVNTMLLNNPVFRRESRVRWRGWRPFALLFIYAMSLSFVLGWGYAANGAGGVDSGIWSDLATPGREMFRTLQMMQMVAWLLIVPILTSTIISSERELGLLEALQLSGLRARHIIGGKIAAILLFVVLLLLVGAPVTSICFLLGGVAPEEFLKSLLLQSMTIFLCATLGLFYSSQARRNLVAVRNSFIAMLVFAGGTAFVFTLNYETGINELEDIAALLTLLNPIRAQIGVFDDFATTYPEIARVTWVAFAHPFRLTLCGLALFSLLFLWGAARGVRKVFDESHWMERKRYLTWRNGRFVWRAATADEAALSRWKNEHPTQTPDLKAKAGALFDTPLATFIHFKNPVLQREVRGKLRMRRYPKPLTVVMSVLATLGGVFYFMAIVFAWTDENSHQDIWTATTFSALAAITLALPLMGAGALPRERDNGTWEMLELSLLPPRQLLAGKLLAPLFFAFCIFVLVVPLLLPCIRYFAFDQSHNYADGPALSYALTVLALLAATSFCYTAWGMWLSSHFRTPVPAMAATLISMLLILGAAPWLLSLISDYNNNSLTDFLTLWHPWMTMGRLFENAQYSSYNDPESLFAPQDAVFNIGFLVFTGFILLVDLNRRITKAWRLPRRLWTGFTKTKTAPAKEAA